MGQEESRLVDDDTPTQTLKDRSIESVAKFITGKNSKNIVVLTGAGISTSAGIPDFRSPETGLYANLARLKLPHAEAVFDISYFRQNPLPFYTLAQELYPGKFRPTITHSFVRLLHKKGLLMKLFTQNIDCLEREAGVPDEKIIEAHGSFARQSCIECKTSYPQDLMQEAIRTKAVPRCLNKACNGLVKPEIVFFGEQLPSAFFENRPLVGQADMCIVMGTSLSVHPFAGLPALCVEGVPRLLINKEAVGDMGTRADDVLVLDDCDAGVRKLARACGWLEELEAIWAETAPDEQPEQDKEAESVEKTMDEELQDEVDQLTREVEKTLQLGNAQVQWYEGKHGKIKISTEDDAVGRDATGQNASTKSPKEREGPTVAESDLHPGNTEVKGGGGADSELGHVFPHLSKKPSL